MDCLMKEKFYSVSGVCRITVLCALLLILAVPAAYSADVKSPEWVAQRSYRILVEVPPVDIGARASDEMPSRMHLSTEDVQRRFGVHGRIDVTSLQVEQFSPTTGNPIPYKKWAYGKEPWEVPYRWYDGSIAEEFPEVVGDVNPDTGELKFEPERNWGYFYETVGEWKSGNIAWIRTQHGHKPSYYAIYFNLLPSTQEPGQVPRRGFVGDGTERIERIGESTHGLLLSRMEAADWNGDGLPDILVGAQRGGIVWYPNRGTRKHPEFPYSKLLFTADGKPLDVGFSATPLVIDWDGDGIQDLLCGVEWNRLVWYKNAGTNRDPHLVYQGFIYTSDGKPFQLPHEPVPEGEGIYKRDYHPVLAAADLNGDGRVDILAGGYVTGRIYFYENEGRDKKNLPILRARGPLEDGGGQALDVGWAAAPTAADVNGDGLIDIISGDMPMTAGGGDSASSENFLYYFKNIGTRANPRFQKIKFPVEGKFPRAAIAAPRLVDLNSDGLLDLVVVQNVDLSIYFNVGSRTAPLWKYAPPLPGKWNTAPLLGGATQFIDWNHDGLSDLVDGFSVRLNQGKGNPQLFGPPQSILAPGEKIFHKSPYGDQWTFTHLVDMDKDGKLDILYAVHEGNVYLHRNLSSGDKIHFDDAGVLLKTEDGKPIKVGPAPGHAWDFDVLQGARATVTAADFDRDGKIDLIVGDTFGKVRYYRNLTGGANPVFAMPVVVADAGTRLIPTSVDWNGDGWPDVLIGSSKTYLLLNSGKITGPRFLPSKPLDLPYLPYETSVMAVDWNQDGDLDLLARASYGYTCWFERSFLEHGYAPVSVKGIESRIRRVP